MNNCKNTHHHQNIEDKITLLLKDNKLSNTLPRRHILNLLLSEHGPFSVEEIIQKLPENTCDQATVYRCLKQFVDQNIVTLSYFDKDHAVFEFNDPDHHHHHIICRKCNKIESFHNCNLSSVEELLLAKGYTNISHRLEIFAICTLCKEV